MTATSVVRPTIVNRTRVGRASSYRGGRSDIVTPWRNVVICPSEPEA